MSRRRRDPLETIRRLALALPEAVDRDSHGEPAWFVQGKRLFAMYADQHHDERVAVWCAAPLGAQETLVEVDPERFFRPPYVGHRGWIGVYLDLPEEAAPALLADLITDADRTVAPRRLVEALDGASG